jgi:hypothetical protein
MDKIILINVRNLLHIPKHNELTIDNVVHRHFLWPRFWTRHTVAVEQNAVCEFPALITESDDEPKMCVTATDMSYSCIERSMPVAIRAKLGRLQESVFQSSVVYSFHGFLPA